MCYSLGCPGGLILDMGYHVLSALAMYLGLLARPLHCAFGYHYQEMMHKGLEDRAEIHLESLAIYWQLFVLALHVSFQIGRKSPNQT